MPLGPGNWEDMGGNAGRKSTLQNGACSHHCFQHPTQKAGAWNTPAPGQDPVKIRRCTNNHKPGFPADQRAIIMQGRALRKLWYLGLVPDGSASIGHGD